MDQVSEKLYNKAYRLSLFTIIYNIAEGVLSIILGYSDETLALFGFGVDSIIEVISGTGIAYMITRIRKNPSGPESYFEKRALQVTGLSFYLLSLTLTGGIVVNTLSGHKPETTMAGIIISVISLIVMFWLMRAKKHTGICLKSPAIIADSNCTKVCVYMSLIVLFSSLLYEITGFAYADSIGAAGLAYFSFSEGREAFEKAG